MDKYETTKSASPNRYADSGEVPQNTVDRAFEPGILAPDGGFVFIKNPSPSQIVEIHEMALKELGPNICSLEVLKSAYGHNPLSLWGIYRSADERRQAPKLGGFFAYLPLNEAGNAALKADTPGDEASRSVAGGEGGRGSRDALPLGDGDAGVGQYRLRPERPRDGTGPVRAHPDRRLDLDTSRRWMPSSARPRPRNMPTPRLARLLRSTSPNIIGHRCAPCRSSKESGLRRPERRPDRSLRPSWSPRPTRW